MGSTEHEYVLERIQRELGNQYSVRLSGGGQEVLVDELVNNGGLEFGGLAGKRDNQMENEMNAEN